MVLPKVASNRTLLAELLVVFLLAVALIHLLQVEQLALVLLVKVASNHHHIRVARPVAMLAS